MEHGHAIAGSGALAWLLDAAGLHAALFLGGLAGGLTHCSVMCGPFVLAQVAARLERESAMSGGELARLAGGALIPFTSGASPPMSRSAPRPGRSPARSPAAHRIRLADRGVPRARCGAVPRAGLRRAPPVGAGGGAIGRAIGRVVTPLMRDPRGWRGYALGVALGFLPCGLLYGAFARCRGGGRRARRGGGDGGFHAGTAPALIAVGWIGVFFGRRWAPAMRLGRRSAGDDL